MNPNTQQRNHSASLRKALAILQYLGDDLDGEGRTLSQIATTLGYNKSTVIRLLQPLLEQAFVEQLHGSTNYRLSWENARLGHAYLAGLRPNTDMHHLLTALSTKTSETVHLVGAATPHVVYIDKVDSSHAVRMFSQIGNTQPMHSTSVGKCILAHASEDAIQSVIETGLPAQTKATITTERALRAELARIRAQGWAIDDIENEEGIRCVAAPVFDAAGRCTYAISVSGPITRVPKSRVAGLAPLVTSTAAEISKRLGAVPER